MAKTSSKKWKEKASSVCIFSYVGHARCVCVCVSLCRFISQIEHDPRCLFIGIIKLRHITIPCMHPVSTGTPQMCPHPPPTHTRSSETTKKKESQGYRYNSQLLFNLQTDTRDPKREGEKSHCQFWKVANSFLTFQILCRGEGLRAIKPACL